MAEALWRRCDSNSGIMAVKWGDNSLVNLASNFVRVEPIGESRKWREKEKGEKKTFHVLKLLNNTTKAWEVWTWWTCCYHCIKYCARQSASTKRYSGISSIRQRSMLGSCRNFRQNGKPHKDQKSLLEVPIQIELSDALILV